MKHLISSQSWQSRISMLAVAGLVLLSNSANARQEQPGYTIRFNLHAPELANEATVHITGSLPQLGDWNPAKVPMKSEGNHHWSHAIRIAMATPIEYKYTLGSWASEGATADGLPLKNLTVDAVADKIINDEIVFWTNGKERPVEGGITGTVVHHRALQAEGLLPRDVIVWLPPGYQDSERRYDVLYMHDGQNIIDPTTSSFGVDWRIDETLTRLIQTKQCRPIIVVGIYCTAERSKDYLPGEQGDRYIQFVCRCLKPLIDGKYRTRPGRESTAIGGSSNGGICAFRIAWENPDLFSKALCFSPAFQARRPDGTLTVDYVSQFVESQTPDRIPFFYLGNGGVGLEKLLQPGIDRMLVAMREKGLEEGRNFEWKLEPAARHEESAWAEQFPAAARVLFGPESKHLAD